MMNDNVKTKLMKAIHDALEVYEETDAKTCVVKRLDADGGLLEYAVADATVVCGDNESIVWTLAQTNAS